MRRLSSDVSDRDIGCGSAGGEKWYTYPAEVKDIVIPSSASRFYIFNNEISLSSSCFHKMSHSPDEMLPPKEPLKRLPQQPLISPTGARLLLCNVDAGYPSSNYPERGKWVDHISTQTFCRFDHLSSSLTSGFLERKAGWRWPAVVLIPEEYNLRVGEMSVTELRSQLEKYWGQGSISGATVEDGYQNMRVPTWLHNTNDPYEILWGVQLHSETFRHWVNRECTQWLEYFIARNHTFGVVHAWFAAFLGVTKRSRAAIEGFMSTRAISHLKFRMSFDVCIQGYDEVVDGIPSLPLNTEITTNECGLQVISNSRNKMFPRRIWDICANTVIPATWFCGPPCPLTGSCEIPLGVKPVSHAWVADADRIYVMTEANQQMWPIPLPKGVQLEDIRGEMIRLGVRYAWLDVLCLRQQFRPALAKDLAIPVREIVEKHNECRKKELKVDVPIIGAIYFNKDINGLYGGGPTVIFMSGLGRPFRDEGWTSERHWLRRAWTLQETPVLDVCLIAGLPGGSNYEWDHRRSNVFWPLNCKV